MFCKKPLHLFGKICRGFQRKLCIYTDRHTQPGLRTPAYRSHNSHIPIPLIPHPMTPLLPALLTFNLNPDKQDAIAALCRRKGVLLAAIPPADFGLTLSELPRNPAAPHAAGQEVRHPFSDEMLLFRHFSDELLEEFLAEYRAAGLAPIFLKAVQTPTNSRWDSYALRDELRREYESFS